MSEPVIHQIELIIVTDIFDNLFLFYKFVLNLIGQMSDLDKYKYSDITVKIIGCAMEVHRALGIPTGLVFLLALASCSQTNPKETPNAVSVNQNVTDSIVKKGNITITYSTDIKKLGKLLDLKQYPPVKVKFKYTFIDNSGKSKRISVPGPSDNYLEALMYFDSATFEKFIDFDRNADYPSPNYVLNDFKFEWLDFETEKELENSNKNYHGHPDFFFGTKNGKCWYLHNEILIKYSFI
jgi:hypothetical protein